MKEGSDSDGEGEVDTTKKAEAYWLPLLMTT